MAKGTSGGASQSAAQSGRNNAINTSAAKNSAASAQQRLKERSAAFKEAQITGAKQINGAAALKRLNGSNNYEGWTPGAIYEQGKINETVDYLMPKNGSVQSDHAQTSRYLDEANNEIRRRKGTDTEQTWIQLANELDNKLRADYSTELGDYRSQLKTLQDEDAILSGNLKNTSRAVEAGMYDSSTMKAYDDGIRQRAQNKARQTELSTKIKSLENEIFDRYATDDIKAARQKLIENNYDMDFSFLAPDEAVSQHDLDQQAVDEFMQSIGSATQYYNFGDRVVGGLKSGEQGVGSSVVGAYGTLRKLGENISAENELNLYATDPTQMATEEEIAAKEAEREAEAQYKATHRSTIGGIVVPTQQEISDLKARANKEAFDNVPIMPGTAADELQKNADAWSKTADAEQKKADDINAQLKGLVGTGEVDVADVMKLRNEAKEHEKNAKDARDLAAQFGGSRASLSYIIRNGSSAEVTHVIDQISWELGDKANEELRKATENAKPIEKMLVHMTKTGVEMGFDAVVGAATGVGGLPVMFTRVFGQASQQANRAGASLPKQVLYGATVAGIEVLTEKIADFGGGLIYGKSFSGDFAKRLIHNLELSPVWEKVMYALADTVGEGLEEGASDLLGGLAEIIIRRNPDKGFWEDLKDLTAEQLADVWYDMLLGSAMGLVGAGGGAITGQYSVELAEQYNADVARDQAAYADIGNEFLQRAGETLKNLGPEANLSGAMQIAQQQAKVQAEKDSRATKINEKIENDETLTDEEFNIAKAAGWVEEKDRADYVRGEAEVESADDEVAPEASGEGVESRLKKGDDKTRKVDENGNPLNRMRKLTDRMARIAERLGYGNKTNQSDAYKTATGMTPEEVDAQNNAASAEAMQEAGAQPKGGDASPYNLDNYDQAGINKLWKDRKMTSGQYAEAMVQKGFWSEATARNFLSLVRREGDRLGLNTAEERKRNLGNYTIGQNNAQNAPQGQAVSEGTPAPAETEKTVKPQAESAEQSAEATSKKSLDELLAETRRLSERNEKSWTKEELDALGRKNVPDMNSIVAQARRAAQDGKYFMFLHSFGTEDPSRYVYDGETVYKIEAGKLAKYASGLEALKFLDSPKVASSTVSWQPSVVDKASVDSLVEKNKLEWDRNIRRYIPTESEAKEAFDDYFDSSKAIKAHKNLATALSLATENHPFKLTASNKTYIFDGKTLDTRNAATGGRVDRIAVVSGYRLEDNHIPRIVDELYRSANSAGSLPNGVTLDQIVDDFIAEASSTTQQESGTIDGEKKVTGSVSDPTGKGKALEDIIYSYEKNEIAREDAIRQLAELFPEEAHEAEKMLDFYTGANAPVDIRAQEQAEQERAIEEAVKKIKEEVVNQESTNKQENDTIAEQKGVEDNGSGRRFDSYNGQAAGGENARRATGVYQVLGRSLEDSHKQAEIESRRYKNKSVRDKHLSNISAFENAGARYANNSEAPKYSAPLKNVAKTVGAENVTFLYAPSDYKGATGLYDKDTKTAYFVLKSDDADFIRHLAKHELTHGAIGQYLKTSGKHLDFRKDIIEKALDSVTDKALARKAFDFAFNKVERHYGVYYCDAIKSEYTVEEWADMPPDIQEDTIRYMLTDEETKELHDGVYEEFVVEAIIGSKKWFGKNSLNYEMDEFQTKVQEIVNNEHIIPNNLLESIDNIDFSQAEASEPERLNVDTDQEPTGNELPPNNNSPPEGSGIMDNQSDSAAMSKQTFRGEEKRVRDSGGTTYVSKTNEERSRVADHQLRDENWDNEINRLLNKDERWDDQDVVTAERAMYKMIRAIRDYQLGNSRKMKKSGFDALIKRYNDLTTRHINEKSKAGQELQATYQFTPEELIMNRMAKTFLGFAKDGTFAGNTNLAVNAKIYAAAEDAANRITKAAEAKDAKALAQICKDISDIRGVKNMFGVASGFASKVENEILNAIAQQENGVEALQTLALGNLNAICDDVQPYKVVNAAKTIRVMNMLSNMSTIINNITNNIASGLTSTNAVSQGASLLASKAFENITGQTVLTPAAKGWVANKEIRNAEMEALKMATLVQLYGVNQENGKLEIQGDKGLFNPNANAFEQTMAMYKFFIGMGVEATDQVKSEGLMKAMNIGIDKALAKGKITEKQAEAMRQEAKHEVNRLLYKDDNRLSGFVQGVRNKLNKVKSWGNDDIGTIGLGDISMAFAKIPANVVRARLYATPEGCLVQLAQYTKGVMKAKRMHSETMARQIMESHAPELKRLRAELQDAYDLEAKEVSRETKDAKIAEIKSKIAALNRECWNEAREKCSGGVYNKLIKMRDNYGSNLDFDDCVQRCKYSDATEMSQFEAATYSRKIGKAATSAGMVALGAILRGLGALRDFDQEPDDELRKMYKQKGYSGLMFNWSAIGRPDHEWRDGDIILDADFLEVVAMPLAIGACARECAMNVEGKGKTKAFVTEAAASGLSKTFEAVGDIPGMADAINLYNAITSQFNTDNAAKGNRVFNAGVQYLANTLPSFFIPNAYTQLGAGLDNTVRDTYTTDNIWQQAGNIMLNKTAFLRKKIPASVDMWGEEQQYGENKFWGVVNKTLLPGDRIKYRQNKYESEIIRLTKEGYKGATPKLSVSGSFEVDGETYTMDADEKRAYRQNRNTEQAEVYQQFMDSPEYAMLTDDQKVAVLKDLKMDCERDAKQTMLNDRGLDVEVTRAKWETELKTTKDQITYLSMKQLAGAAWDSEENRVSDYAAMDAFLKDHYGDMSKEMRDILDGSMSQLDKMYDARKVGIGSEMWQKAYDIYKQYNSDEGEAAVDGGFKDWEATEMWTKMEKATGASNAQMNWFEENMGLMRHMRVDPEHYQDLTDKLGWSRESSSYLTKAMSELQPSNGNKTVSYKQRLRCIAETPNVSDDQKWEAFYEYCPSSYTKIINGMTNLRNRGYTYEQALKTYKSGKNSMWWKYEGE